jgi:ubiquinone/menaquinone biosynthesis C-methylase UbiE
VNSDEINRIRAVYARWEPTYDRTSPGFLMLLGERNARLKQLLAALPQTLARCRVLDVGCGCGDVLNLFYEQGAAADNLFGIDLLSHRIHIARERYPLLSFREGNAEQIDFPDRWFDIATVFTVFSSIFDRSMAENVACEIDRVRAPGGAIVWYDMRYPNPWNRNVRPMTKARIRELFPSFQLELESLTVLPPLARRLGSGLNTVYPLLARVPILRSHYLGLLRSKKQRIGESEIVAEKEQGSRHIG